MWAGANSTSQPEALVVLESPDASRGVYTALIQNNTIEGVTGPAILLKLGASGSVIRGIGISGNRFYQPSPTEYTDNTFPVVQVVSPGARQGYASCVLITDNIIEGASASARYKSIVDWGPNTLQDNS